MRCVRVVVVVGFAALTLQAQEIPPDVVDPVLDELLQTAEKSPDLVAARAQAAAAAQQSTLAGALSDPVLALSYANDGWAPSLGQRDMSALQFMWSQAFPAPGKRKLRSARAESESQLEAARADATRRALRVAVKRAYALLRLSRGLLDLTRQQARLLAEVEGVVRARYAAGQGGQQDVLRAQIELTRVEPTLDAQQAETFQRLQELNRLVGRALDTPIETQAELELHSVGQDGDTWLARVRGQSPALAAAELQNVAGRADVDLARSEFKPDWALQAGYATRGRLDPMWQAGVAINLPLRRGRLAAGVAAAEARVQAGNARRQALDADLELGVRTRLLQLQVAERSVRVYDKGLLPQGRLSVDAAIANYQGGKVPFITVLEALASLYGDDAARLRLLAAHAGLRASLEEAQLGPALESPALEERGTSSTRSSMEMGR
jgi:outer membrane protein, heavy metal efflux system